MLIADLDLAEATLLVAALTLAVAATTLYLTRFRAGRIALRHVPTHLEWSGTRGGTNGVPNLTQVTLRLAASNPGSHPCVLERLVVDQVNVDGPSDLATGAAGGKVTGAPGTDLLSAVIDPGNSKQFEFGFKLQGEASSAVHTRPTPDLGPLAMMIGQLAGLTIVVRGEYQSTFLGKTRTRSATVRVALPVELARRNAVDFWTEKGKSELAKLVAGAKG